MKIWKAYKYIYYWLFTWQKKLWGENDVPEFNAICGMTISLMSNITTLLIVLFLINDKKLNFSKFDFVISILSILLIHYFLFMHKKKYLKIEKEFKSETKKSRKTNGIWVLLYTFGSIAFFIFMMFFGIWFNNNFS